MNALARQILAEGSKSFALAGKLLPPGVRDDAAIVYAWCRRADDHVDGSERGDDVVTARDPALARQAVDALRAELRSIYAGAAQTDPVLAAFQEVALRRRIPEHYPHELLEGMATDAAAVPLVFESLPALLHYCYRVAGTVGLMMCHVMGVRGDRSLTNAVHLGMAMQLTNICRDVAEDWRRGRLYVPRSLLGLPEAVPAGTLDTGMRARLAAALPTLLAEAERFYQSGERGLPALSFRCAIAIRAARSIYSDIGRVLALRAYDVTLGRAVVSKPRKLFLAVCAAGREMLARARHIWGREPSPFPIPASLVRFADVPLTREIS